MSFALKVLPLDLAICKLGPGSGLPTWAKESSFLAYTKTPEEESIVCEEFLVPSTVNKNGGWKAFYIAGKLDFSLVGIVSRITTALAEQGISVFVLSTFDTDYVLVKTEVLERALKILQNNGFNF